MTPGACRVPLMGQRTLAGELAFGFLGLSWAPWQQQGRFRAFPVLGLVSAQLGLRQVASQRPTTGAPRTWGATHLGVPRTSSSASPLWGAVSLQFPYSTGVTWKIPGNSHTQDQPLVLRPPLSNEKMDKKFPGPPQLWHSGGSISTSSVQNWLDKNIYIKIGGFCIIERDACESVGW